MCLSLCKAGYDFNFFLRNTPCSKTGLYLGNLTFVFLIDGDLTMTFYFSLLRKALLLIFFTSYSLWSSALEGESGLVTQEKSVDVIMKNDEFPDPDSLFPIKDNYNLCFLKNLSFENNSDNIVIGDYTYYYDSDNVQNFEKNILYHFEEIGDKLIMGKFCQIGQGVKFLMNGGNHKFDGFTTFPFQAFGKSWEKISTFGIIKGDIVIGNDVWLGEGATIMPGIKIGDGAIVAAESVVTKNVSPYTVVGGNPATPLRDRFDVEVTSFLLDLKWWNLPIHRITELAPFIVNGDIQKLRHLTKE